MNIREASSSRREYSRSVENSKPKAPRTKPGPVLMVLVLIAVLISGLFLGISHASALGSPIKSGWDGYCLDDYRSDLSSGNQVDLWSCNNSSAQDWQVNLTQIVHDNNRCLTANSDTDITLDTCDQAANQVWLRDDQGFLNPDKGLCLSGGTSSQDSHLSLASCSDTTQAAETWTPNLDYATYPCSGTQGQKVACFAIKDWVQWTSEPKNHEALLNNYTGGAAYEEWCADFISYVFKQAGYPFSNGNYGGWDENIAGDIANQGFTTDSSSTYTPQPGDVGYFNYPGGHVEIVIVGGKHPTFLYGNSAIIDPTTGNGDMAANTIVSDPALGQLQYYMSPNSST